MTKEDALRKITSRKFIICLAAFLASISTSITGLNVNNEIITSVGLVCGVLSAAFYAAMEAHVDATRNEVIALERQTSLQLKDEELLNRIEEQEDKDKDLKVDINSSDSLHND